MTSARAFGTEIVKQFPADVVRGRRPRTLTLCLSLLQWRLTRYRTDGSRSEKIAAQSVDCTPQVIYYNLKCIDLIREVEAIIP